MAAAAMQTATIRLGTGVLIPSNRIAPVAASGLASLNALAPGPDRLRRLHRLHGSPHDGAAPGEARGHGRVHPRRARAARGRDARVDLRGQAPEDPLPESRGRRLQHRRPDSPAHRGAGAARSTAHRQARRRLDPRDREPRPRRGAIADMQAVWRDAGRDPAAHDGDRRPSPAASCRDGEAADSPRARAHAGPTATIALHSLVERDEFGDLGRPIPRELAPSSSATGRSTLEYEPADARYLQQPPRPPHVPPSRGAGDLHRRSDPRDDVHRRRGPSFRSSSASSARAGFDHVGLTVRHGHPEMLEEWADVFEGV